jgi:hypothetical protein
MEKEEALVTLEESHNSKLSNKLSMDENGEEMNYFVKEWWWCSVWFGRAKKKREVFTKFFLDYLLITKPWINSHWIA